MSLILTNRLNAVYELVRSNRKTVDVGTDHGYLPAFLVIEGKTDCAVAADIGIGPLENAKKTIEKYGLGEKIKTVQSNGLQNIDRDTEEIIIAGMGGTLIAEILSAAEWIRNENIHLVLQPMTHSYDVRKFLCENGFYIDNESFCTDDCRYYVVLSAYYNGKDNKKDDFYYYFGNVASKNTENEKEYIKKQAGFISNRYEGLMKAGKAEEAEKFDLLLKKIKQAGWSELK